ncbi:hypothetical protein [Clostridium akagii]|uniref:hypothetical protein n=1 Tax=Clostridium akagii TaxID=91623 RepID=UPI000A8B47B4|nr:hypothetical protein [Clostridium akagii]
MDLAFNTLISNLNAQIKALNDNNFKLYDAENREYFIDTIRYDKDEDKLVCEFKEDEE